MEVEDGADDALVERGNWDVYGEEEDGGWEVYDSIDEIIEIGLHSQGEVAAFQRVYLFPHLLVSKHAPIYPPFPLPHQSMYGFNRVHMGYRIRDIYESIPILIDLHAKYPILCEENILVIEQLLLWLFLHLKAEVVEQCGQEYSEEDLDESDIGGFYFALDYFVLDGFEVFAEQSIAIAFFRL